MAGLDPAIHALLRSAPVKAPPAQLQKVFWFFFSKKNRLLA
jgi:hypothetical protein